MLHEYLLLAFVNTTTRPLNFCVALFSLRRENLVSSTQVSAKIYVKCCFFSKPTLKVINWTERLFNRPNLRLTPTSHVSVQCCTLCTWSYYVSVIDSMDVQRELTTTHRKPYKSKAEDQYNRAIDLCVKFNLEYFLVGLRQKNLLIY